MTEEEYFRKNYPDSCYGNKPLSPYWDFFQDGVEFGERESEKKIAELEQENKVLTQNLEDTEIVNKALEKENAELKQAKEGKVVEHFEAYGQCRDSRRIAELEARIEKMKCCGNCAKRGHICVAEEMQGNLCGKNKDKWELRR